MDFELKTLLETLDLKDVKDLDTFKKTFNEKFIAKSQIFEEDSVKEKIAGATGKATGAFATLLKREFELTSDEIKDKKWEDIAQLGITKTKAKIKELEETVGAGGDEKVKAIQAKLEKRDKEFGDLKSLLDTTKEAVTLKDQEIAKIGQEFGTKLKGFKATTLIEKAKEKIMPKLKDKITEAERFYLDAKINESFVIDFDDKDEAIVLDKAGKRIQNTKVVGTFLNVEEAVEAKAIELGFDKKNNGGQGVDLTKILGQNQNQPPVNTQQQNAKPAKAIHPSALKHAELMKAQAHQ